MRSPPKRATHCATCHSFRVSHGGCKDRTVVAGFSGRLRNSFEAARSENLFAPILFCHNQCGGARKRLDQRQTACNAEHTYRCIQAVGRGCVRTNDSRLNALGQPKARRGIDDVRIPDAAVLEYQIVLRLNPTNSAALNDLAWIRAAAPEAKLRDGLEAVKFAEEACKLTEFHEPQLIGTLAASYAQAGRFEEAIKTAERARDLAASSGSKELVAKNEELLAFYREHRPYQEPEPPQK